ncbi:MAG TPA: hypothetical protein QF571_12165, partial [Desulfobacterales bacterium]|nr:hypothetical protein [Desulfobacterales bacterium]
NAYQMAAVDPSTVDLFEAHGTGTRVGDFVEFQALNNVFSQSSAKKKYLRLGFREIDDRAYQGGRRRRWND